MKSLWVEDRQLYQMLDNCDQVIAEVEDTRTMMRMCMHDAEVEILRKTYLQQDKALREFIEAYPPANQE